MSQDIRHFAEELVELKQRLLEMGHLAEEHLRLALRALVERDHDLVAKVITGDGDINRLNVEIDDRCFKLLALHQPMAVDLRVIVAVIKISNDLERVGDLAVNIAQATERYVSRPMVKPLIDMPRMGEIALVMLRDALDAFLAGDVEAAKAVLTQDDVLDDLKDQIFRELLTYMLGDTTKIEPGIDLILISRHLERVGDHATNIAEDVVFLVKGVDIRHNAERMEDKIA